MGRLKRTLESALTLGAVAPTARNFQKFKIHFLFIRKIYFLDFMSAEGQFLKSADIFPAGATKG